jgi:hypothetical protein
MGDSTGEPVERRGYWDHREARWVIGAVPIAPIVPAQSSVQDRPAAVAPEPEVDVRSG